METNKTVKITYLENYFVIPLIFFKAFFEYVFEYALGVSSSPTFASGDGLSSSHVPFAPRPGIVVAPPPVPGVLFAPFPDVFAPLPGVLFAPLPGVLFAPFPVPAK